LKRDEILGKDTADIIEGIAPETDELVSPGIDTDRLRDKLLE